MISFLGITKNFLTVVEETTDLTRKDNSKYRVKCLCQCGKIIEMYKHAFGKSKSCGCHKKQDDFNKALKNIGKRYGKLTLVEYHQVSLENKKKQMEMFM